MSANREVTGVLEQLGGSLLEDLVYRHLVTVPAATPARLAAAVGAEPASVTEALRTLQHRGLVGTDAGDPACYVAAAPEIAVEAALREREAALQRARGELAELVDAHRSALKARTAGEIVEIVDDPEVYRRRILALMHSTHDETLALVRPPFIAVGDADARANPIRGLRSRIVYDRAVFDEVPDLVPLLQSERRPGSQYRLHSHLPLKLTIYDRATASLPAVTGLEMASSMLIVRRSSLLDALIGFFEHVWHTATPFPGIDCGAAEQVPDDGSLLDPVDHYLMSLLLTGLTDQAIAGQLGIGLRSVQRRVHDLMMRTGAQTRIQLGWHAAREGWLSADPQQFSRPCAQASA
jgi:sugar-specific transcriptional regulator TrmB/DNA-binding CsgD family transcriptional regulator